MFLWSFRYLAKMLLAWRVLTHWNVASDYIEYFITYCYHKTCCKPDTAPLSFISFQGQPSSHLTVFAGKKIPACDVNSFISHAVFPDQWSELALYWEDSLNRWCSRWVFNWRFIVFSDVRFVLQRIGIAYWYWNVLKRVGIEMLRIFNRSN